jgi:hypothetical protein
MLWVEERPRNVIYLLLKFLIVKIDQLNAVSQNAAVDRNVYTTLNETYYICYILEIFHSRLSRMTGL